MSSTMGLSDEEHHRTGCRAAFVDAHALLKDECGVEGECEEFRKWSDDYILGFFEGVTVCPPEGYLEQYEKENNDAGL